MTVAALPQCKKVESAVKFGLVEIGPQRVAKPSKSGHNVSQNHNSA